MRLLVGALVLVRLWTASSLPHVQALLLVAGFWSVNLVGYVAERQKKRDRTLLGMLELLADTLVVLLVAWAQRERMSADSADWALLVLPAIEGAIRFRVPGAIASWLILAGGYAGANMASSPNLTAAAVAQRLTVVLLVALPVGYLADHLVAEIEAHRRGRGQAEERSLLLRTAALGGWRTSRLDVDEILDVINGTIGEMGFTDPKVFELIGPSNAVTGVDLVLDDRALEVRSLDDSSPDDPALDDRLLLSASPVPGSALEPAIAAGDPRLRAAAAVRATGNTTFVPLDPDGPAPATLVALPLATIDEHAVVITTLWPGPDGPPDAPVESLELFVTQAGASLRNAQVHRRLEDLKDRLDHEASHDPLTELANRRRFTEELGRTARRGRPGNLVGVLFLDLDGFKDVNDNYGHDLGNDLLVAVAERLRECVRPGDLVARLGGDEFTIMLTRLESVAPAAAVGERICARLSEPFRLGAHEIRISTSVGIALAPGDAADGADLLRRADAAMYTAKSSGKARWNMDPGSLESASLQSPGSLQTALDAEGYGPKNL